jgi:hypothetical protein
MKKYIFFICLYCAFAIAQDPSATRPKYLVDQYIGGHFCYFELSLYSDSSFRYLEAYDFMFVTHHARGIFFRTDSTITMVRKKRLGFMRRSEVNEFRLLPDRILMYTPEQERSADSNYYRNYYTLMRAKE